MTVHDSYTEWDAAYVLGALTPAERREFEDHLTACNPCRASVADFAGMPALLAQVPAGEVLAMDTPGGSWVGETIDRPQVARVLGARRTTWRVPLAAAAAALVVGGMAGYAASSATSPAPPPGVTAGSSSGSGANARLAFSAVLPSTMTAVVDVHRTAARTEFRLECQYASPSSPGGPASRPDYGWVNYAIWVVDRHGRATQLQQWTARPGLIMRPTGVATVPYAALASVEIRRVDDGQTVMRATLT